MVIFHFPLNRELDDTVEMELHVKAEEKVGHHFN